MDQKLNSNMSSNNVFKNEVLNEGENPKEWISESREFCGRIKNYYKKPPIVQVDDSVMTIVKLMSEFKMDAAICVSEGGGIEGIITDKDICYKVVYQGLDLEETKAIDIMTPEPKTIMDDCRTSIALSFMVRHSIRHLPVLSVAERGNDGIEASKWDNMDISLAGVVDISTCIYDRLEDLEHKIYEDHNIITALDVLERRGKIDQVTAGAAKANLNVPDIEHLLNRYSAVSGNILPPRLLKTDTIFDAAVQMYQNLKTAVIIVDESGSVCGIFTTLDLIFRVLSKNCDPHVTTLAEKGSPNPVCIDTSVSLLSSISIMKEKKIKHLPVVNYGECIAIVEVSELAMATLEYLFNYDGTKAGNTMSNISWKEFWDGSKHKDEDIASDNSRAEYLMNSQKHSVSSYGKAQKYSGTPISGSDLKIKYNHNSIINTFNYKLRINNSNKVLRFKTTYNSIMHLKTVVIKQLESCYNIPIANVEICYKDLDNDIITFTNDKSLVEAVSMFHENKKNSMELVVVSLEKKKTNLNNKIKEELLPLIDDKNTNSSFLVTGDLPSTDENLNNLINFNAKFIRKNVSALFSVTFPLVCITLFFVYKKFSSGSARRTFNSNPEGLLW